MTPDFLARLIEKLERSMTPKPNDHAQEGANYAIGRIVRVLKETEKEQRDIHATKGVPIA